MESGKIFVGGLDWHTEIDGLKSHFSTYGEVTDCVVMKNPMGKSRGFGFVTFADPDVVNVVLAKKHNIDGRQVDAKPCSARGSSNGASKGGQRPGFTGRTTKIFVGGLPNDATEDNLKSFFSKYGQVTDVVIMMDNEKMRPRGFGFLTFDSEDAVEEAVKDHYTDFHGKKIEMKRAEPRQGRKQNFNNEQGWGDGWNQSQSGYGGYGQGNSYGGYGNQGYDNSWGNQGQYGGQSWGPSQGGYNYGQGGYNQQAYGQGYSNSAGYGGQSYGGASAYGGSQGYTGASQGYNSGSQGYSSGGSAQGYGGGQGGYSGSGQQNSYSGGGGSQDGYGGGGKAASGGGSQGSYHPYKRT